MNQHDCGSPAPTVMKALRRKAEDIRREASKAQHKAANPKASVFVSAHAGSGKTYLLVNRVIRLLLTGTPPERILCITYTRAAAAVMRTRIFERLAAWIDLPDDKLLRYIHEDLDQKDFPRDQLARARRLFARALETPGGLRVFTIHGFCERLLQAFPVEAGLPPGFEVLEEAEAAELLANARTRLLTAPEEEGAQVRAHLALLATWQYEGGLSSLLADMLRHRPLLQGMAQDEGLKQRVYLALAQQIGIGEEPLDAEEWRQRWLHHSALQELPLHLQALDAAIAPVKKAKSTDRKARQQLERLAQALANDDLDAAWSLARAWFATSDGSPRKALLTKAVREELPTLTRWLKQEQERFIIALQGYLARQLLAANVALYEAAMALLTIYEREKLRAGKFDFDDLISHTLALLNERNLKAAWVLYRLDGGIDHILLDEAQDTSPEQWEILKRITEDFFAGESRQQAGERTVFAVGDVKQSIYSFQGAAPEAFRHMRDFFRQQAKAAHIPFEVVPLEVSFRSAPEILHIVDQVITQDDFDLGEDDIRKHKSARPHVRGLVELWPLEEAEEREKSDDPLAIWQPPQEIPIRMRPQMRLAMRIADTIAAWLEQGEALPPDRLDKDSGAKDAGNGAAEEEGPRLIRPRDILILVRNRSGIMDELISALKRRGIPVAGADRLKVSEHIAVRDLIALGRFLLLPTDDLSLAEVLKSPLVERDDGEPFTDDDLLRLRGELHDFAAPLEHIAQIHDDKPLWRQLQLAAQRGAPVQKAVRRLKRWRAMAGQMPPFELFGHVLWRDGGMARFLRRLSHEVIEPLEAFLDLALEHERIAQPSLEAFIRWLASDAPEIRREQEGEVEDGGPGEVQIMTVHGAKGLERPIVFLVDTVRVPTRKNLRLIDIPLPGDETGTRLPLWTLSVAQRPQAVESLVQQELKRQEEEYNRLLYVAMTRAADRLIVCGAETGQGGKNGNGEEKDRKTGNPRIVNWYQRIARVMMSDEFAVSLEDGRTVWRFPPDAANCRTVPEAEEGVESPLPDWLFQPARPEPGPAEWIAPSKIAAPGLDEEPGASAEVAGPGIMEEPVLSPLATSHAVANPLADPFRRGQLIHRLLQYLPGIAAQERKRRALEWLRQAEPHLGERQLLDIWAEVKRVMADARFAALFGPEARAEVPFAARLDGLAIGGAGAGGADGVGAAAALVSGQIDRLVVTEREVLIADFKTARPVPQNIEEVPPSYIRQMALYRLAMQQLWPQRGIRCVLLFTAGPKWLEIPPERLDAAMPVCAR